MLEVDQEGLVNMGPPWWNENKCIGGKSGPIACNQTRVKYCHSPTQPQLELVLDLKMGRFQDWDLRLWLGKSQAWLLTLHKYKRWMGLVRWQEDP